VYLPLSDNGEIFRSVLNNYNKNVKMNLFKEKKDKIIDLFLFIKIKV
jgi:hypothetical protein